MAQQNIIGKHCTTIKTIDNTTKVRYHNTDVVCFNDDKIILNNDGYFTPTTKNRMNQASSQFNLGYKVYQKNFIWYVYFDNKTYEYRNSKMVLNRNIGQFSPHIHLPQ